MICGKLLLHLSLQIKTKICPIYLHQNQLVKDIRIK